MVTDWLDVVCRVEDKKKKILALAEAFITKLDSHKPRDQRWFILAETRTCYKNKSALFEA